jgi:VWFA-related protein
MSRWVRAFLLSGGFLFVVVMTGAAQDLPETATIHVSTRLVYVDVVVRDSSGNVVRGLPQESFHVKEDGKAQAINFFTAHTLDTGTAAAATRQPAGVENLAAGKLDFTNVESGGGAPGAVNVILLDLLNTPATDQIDARRQLLKFLEGLPSGQQVALFLLTDRLRMIQSFTGSSEQLREAARRIDPKDFHFVRSETEQMQEQDMVVGWAKETRGSGPGQALAKALAREDVINADLRARTTIAALEELARATSGYAGRKNLLWLSDDFPMVVGDQLTDVRYEQFRAIPRYRETLDEMANAKLAIYPISLKGLPVGGVSASSSGVGEASLMGGPSGSFKDPQMGSTLGGQASDRASYKVLLNEIARQTGGDAFVGTNDFALALRRSMIDGANYYTLAYHPLNGKWDGHFRKISVEVDGKGYSLAYRRGYFADVAKPAAGGSVKELVAAMQPETPQSTMLSLRAKVEMADKKHPAMRVDSVLELPGIGFTTAPDGAHDAQLVVLLVAFKEGDKVSDALPQTSGVLRLHLTEEQYAEGMRSGVPIHQELALPSGHYRLRLGVMDYGNQNVGTLDMPVVLTGN